MTNFYYCSPARRLNTLILTLITMAVDVPLPPILKKKYPAKAHAQRVAQYLRENGGNGKGVIYLEGQKDKLIEVCP